MSFACLQGLPPLPLKTNVLVTRNPNTYLD
jgi:hypothetical protein